jgi:hypothetical protein
MNDKKEKGKSEKAKEKSFEDLIKEVDLELAARDAAFEEFIDEEMPEWDAEEDEILPDNIAVKAVMHRDAHFGGKFEQMYEYYSKGGKGAHLDFDVELIESLFDLEKNSDENLSFSLLSESDRAKVAHVSEIYEKLKEARNKTGPQDKFVRLIAELILSEEEYPEAIIRQIVAEKDAIVPVLVELLQSEHFHDTLFPGYGLAPQLAAYCLGLIGGKRAIIALFESLGHENFFNEEMIIDALKHIGEPAKDFLLQVLQGKTLTSDTEKAALILDHFRDFSGVAEAGIEMLKRKDVQNNFILSTYLILMCEGLKDEAKRQEFRSLSKNSVLVPQLRRDMDVIVKSWVNGL